MRPYSPLVPRNALEEDQRNRCPDERRGVGWWPKEKAPRRGSRRACSDQERKERRCTLPTRPQKVNYLGVEVDRWHRMDWSKEIDPRCGKQPGLRTWSGGHMDITTGVHSYATSLSPAP